MTRLWRRTLLFHSTLLLAGLCWPMIALADDAALPGRTASAAEAELVTAAQRGDVVSVKRLLAEGVAVDARSAYGATPLFFAADKGNLELATVLLGAGAKVDVVDTFYKATPFEWALFKAGDSEPHRALVRLMLPAVPKESELAGNALALGVEHDDLAMVQLAIAAEAPAAARRAALETARKQERAALVAFLEPLTPPAPADAFVLDPATIPRYLGDFADKASGLVGRVEAVEAGLQLVVPGQDPLVLEPASATEFGVRGVPGLGIRFELGEGPAFALVVVQGDRETVATRVATTTEEPAAAAAPSPLPPTPERLADQPWPAFRGANRAGIADGQGAPRTWDGETGAGLAWKTKIPGLGLSSPVIWGDRVFVTTAVSESAGAETLRTGLYGDVDSVEDTSSHTWKLLAVDLASGAIAWERSVATGAPKVKRHLKSSHANPTAATDGHVVVASFGSEGLAAFTLEGELAWKVDLGVVSAGWFFDPTYEWEFASSPIIYRDKVYLQADVHGGAFVVALDLATGKERWRTSRDEIPTWSTPSVLPNPGDGPDELVTNGTRAVRGYDVATGKELWTLSPNSEIVVASPVIAEGMAFVVGGYPPVRPIYAIKPGGRGDLSLGSETSSATVAWSDPRGGTYIPTPLVYRGLLYLLHNNGRLAVHDAATGEEVYRDRVGRGEGFSGSPIAADGVIYATAEGGTTYLIRAGRAFELLGSNELGEAVLTTPAISAGRVVIRGQQHLYALVDAAPVAPAGESAAALAGE